MPPRASTSRSATEPSSRSRSPPSSVKNRDADEAMMDGGAGSSDDELADEQYEESEAGPTSNRGKSSAASSSRARSSAKRRSPTTASAVDSNDQVMMHEGSAGGLSREEAALADRRRRNRETQRAIRKKKAARLQDAEVKVSVFESEIEKLKVNLRELELENMALKREIEDWRMGRIHANPSLVAAASRQSAAPSSRLDDERHHPYAARVPYSEHPAYTRAPSAAHYQTYELPAEERKILGKRRQSFDTHQLPPSSTHPEQLSSANLTTRGPLYGRASPSSAQAHASSHSPSVLQPVPTFPYSRHTPPPGHTSAVQSARPEVDTHSNGEGSYGGSDPSPSSAGTVVPSYSSAYNEGNSQSGVMTAGANIVNEAVQAVRAQEEHARSRFIVNAGDNVPRSHSIPSTISTSISEASSPKHRRSYDDYNDFWTSASTTTSQSQSDSLTSASNSSFSKISASYGQPPLATPGGSAIADGMILSMSRQSLCASPLSIAEDRDESMYSVHQEPIVASKEVSSKPSLPSLSSSLKRPGYPAGHRSPDRTASLPLPSPSIAGSPPAGYTPSYHPHHHYAPRAHNLGYPVHSASPDVQARTLPPISSVFQSRQGTLPAVATQNKPILTTRNGRGKSTSYPILNMEDHIEAAPPTSFNWPTAGARQASTPLGGPILPLPRRAATRPPMSNTRDDEVLDPVPEVAPHKVAVTVMSPSAFDESAVVDGADEDAKGFNHDDRRPPQRRKSTYEDFVELFGSHPAAAHP